LGVVYSEFVSGEGLAIFTYVLERKNYVYWRDANEMGGEFDIPTLKSAKQKKLTYAIISGNVPYSERESIIKTFNNKKNISGDYISLLLISKSGAEGLSLRNCRSIHIMEPFWNYARIEQIIARGVRFHSHTDLPEKERTVQPYIYISTYPKKSTMADLEPRTTDEELLHLSMNGKKLRDQFELALIESSIDCSLNYKNLDKSIQEKITCYLCTPNNRPLYSDDIRYDIKNNNCMPFQSAKIDAKQIKLDNDDTIYYYTENPVKIYQFNKDVGGYTEMKKGDKYSELLKKILF
jgi:superfamily II DNA or RNA helicase